MNKISRNYFLISELFNLIPRVKFNSTKLKTESKIIK